ncbi:hypothetical protein QDK53_22305 [Amycolatopsis magusensis]|nr:hypothetical protein [Amycolatopsis magusensis]
MPKLVWAALGLVLVASGCAGEEAPPPAAAPPTPSPVSTQPTQPSPELITWMGELCEATSSLVDEQAEFEGLDVDASRPDTFAEVSLSQFLSGADRPLAQLAGRFTGLPPSGVPAADELAKSLGAGLERIVPEVQALAGDFGSNFGQEFGPLHDRARKLDELVDSVKPAGPDLPTLLAAEPRLAAAHDLSPNCRPDAESSTPAPDGPLPPAADGTDFGACADGTCQILVTGESKVKVGDLRFTISVTDETVTLKDSRAGGGSSEMRTGAGGEASWGRAGGQQLMMTVSGLNAEGAVLDFKTQ